MPLGLLLAIALAALSGRALIHGRNASDSGRAASEPVQRAAIRSRSATSVLVLNGNGLGGAAGVISSRLLADGYRSAPTANAQTTTYARSLVLYRPGWEGEANRLAKDAHIATVAPLDGPLPATASGSPLVVIAGH